MQQAETRQFVIYSRKSKFTGKGESIGNQIELCRQYIFNCYGAAEAAQALVYEDEGFSGGSLDRPQFRKMMEDSKKRTFTAIVVYRLDRISRNIGDFAKLIEDLGSRKIGFISIREQFDTDSPMGRAMMYIASVFSQLERETIAERIRDNMHELAKTGRWLGGTTPTGYASESVSHVTVDGKVKKACKLKAVPEEIQLVQTIFGKFLETGSLTKVDQYLLETHCETKYGRQFSRFAIRGILTNPVYMIADEAAYAYLTACHVDLFSDKTEFDGVHGVMAYNRTLQRPGKTHQRKPMEEWIVAVGKHPGVIPGETWVHVQNMLERNRSKAYRKPRSHEALLSGLLYCGSCGSYMRPKRTDRVNAAGEPVYTYLCTTKERSRGSCCAMKNAGGNQLDALVLTAVGRLAEDSPFLAGQLLRAKPRLSDPRESAGAESARVKAKLEENGKAIQSLVASLAAATGTSAAPYIVERIEALHGEGEALRAYMGELEAANAQNRLTDAAFEAAARRLSRFEDVLGGLPVEQKRTAVRALVHKIVWDGETAHLYLPGSGDDP